MKLKQLQRGHIGYAGPGSDEEPLIDFRGMWNRLVWRIRFTTYGQRKTKWGWLLWWEWSDTAADDNYDATHGFGDHEYAADENIYDALN